MYIILLQTAQFYTTQQAYGLWPQVWPVPEENVIKGYGQFLYHIIRYWNHISCHLYDFIPSTIICRLIFFIVGWLTIRNIIKKLEYQETLLRD